MNTKFSYMYRDGGNYKTFYSFVFEGEISQEQLKRFEEVCADEYFMPRALGLSGGVMAGEEGYDSELDHLWCEHDFEDSFELVNDTPNLHVVDGKMGVVKILDFLGAFEKCSENWEVALSKPVNLLDFKSAAQDLSLSELISSAENATQLRDNVVQVALTKDEIELIKKSLNEMGDRLADREGYSSGEKCWDLKEKLETIEGRSKGVER